MRNKLVFLGNQTFGRIPLLGNGIRFFYLSLFIPLLKKYLKRRHANLSDLVVRNSIFENNNFNAFLSDIDTTLILKEEGDCRELIKDFLKIKRLFIMLDFPELYTEEEYKRLEDLKKKDAWKIIDLLWNIRKINWSLSSLQKDKSKLNSLKMKRSIEKSQKKILKSKTDPVKGRYFLADFKFLESLFDTRIKDIFICYYSVFLGTDKSGSMVLELSRPQYLALNSLMPGEEIDVHDQSVLSPFYHECKQTLEAYEKLIAISSIRLKKGQGMDSTHLEKWYDRLSYSREF